MKSVAGPPRGNVLISIFLIWIPAILLLVALGIGAAVLGGAGFKQLFKKDQIAVTEIGDPAPDSGEATTGAATTGATAEAGTTAEPAPVVAKIDPAVLKAGKASYIVCQGCHGPDGKGLQAGALKMAPSLHDSLLANGDPTVMAALILRGIEKEGADYAGVMMPLPLNDDQISAVATYVRHTWGNGGEVTPAHVAEARTKFADVKVMLKRAELEEFKTDPEGLLKAALERSE